MNITITDVEKIMKSWKNDPEYLIEMLQDIQESCRYLPEEALRHIAHTLDIPLKRLYHISTFFSMFSLEEKGENIVQVCMGTACHVKGAPAVLEAFARELKIHPGETTNDKKFTVEGVRCLGCCSLAPAVAINEKIYGGVTVAQVPEIIKETKEAAKPKKKAAKAQPKTKAAKCACEEKTAAKKSTPAAKTIKAKATKTATKAKPKAKAAKPAKDKTTAKPKATPKAAKVTKSKKTASKAKPKAKAVKKGGK